MSNIVFAWPYSALLLLLLPVLWIFLNKRKSKGEVLESAIAISLKDLKQSFIPKKRMFYGLFLSFILLVIALMRPQYSGAPLTFTRDGRNIMLVVDTSESMEAEDMVLDQRHTDRLSVTKNVLHEFINKRRGDRIGLVVFGTETFLHAPLSFDHVTIKQFLDDAQIGFAGPKTAIGDAIALGVKKLMNEKGDKVLVLLTDGQNNAGSLLPEQAAQIAKVQGVKIYVVGLGASRMVVDGFFGPTAVNPSISLDEAEPELKEMATLTGGRYFRARDRDSLSQIYNEIDKLEPIKTDPLTIIPKKDLFYWPLSLFLILFFIRVLFLIYQRASARAYHV